MTMTGLNSKKGDLHTNIPDIHYSMLLLMEKRDDTP